MIPGPQRAVNRAPTQHDGSPLSPDDDFPVQPDPAIGNLLSSQSNRTRSGWKKMSEAERGPRIALGVIAFLVGGILGAAMAGGITREIAMQGFPQIMLWQTPLVVLGGIAGCVVPTGIVVLFAFLTRRRRASFIGDAGVMDWQSGFLGLLPPKSRVLRFEDANELRVQRTRQFVNGVYTGTFYTYTWTGHDGRVLLLLNGSFNDKQPIPAHDPISFAHAAENAWTKHKIALVDRALRNEGVARFASGRDVIGVGKNFLELHAGGRMERVDRSELESVTAQQGTLVVRKRGAKDGFFTSEGIFRFPISQMADFHVFAITLEEQLQIRLG